MRDTEQATHYRGPLAGLGAGAAGVLTGGGLILIAARRQLDEVAAVVAWAVTAAVILAVIAAAVYVFLWLRHRVRHPEVLSGRQAAVTAEVLAAPAPPQAVTAPAAAAIEPPRDVHLHFHTAGPAEAAEIIYQALPGQAGDAITRGT